MGGTDGAITVQIGTTSGGTDVLAATNYVQGWHSVAFTSTATALFIRFSYNFGVTSVRGGLGGAYLYRSNAHLLELSATEGSVTATASGHTPFVASDVGRLLRLSWPGKEPCWGVITSFISTSSVQLRLRRKAPYASVPSEDQAASSKMPALFRPGGEDAALERCARQIIASSRTDVR